MNQIKYPPIYFGVFVFQMSAISATLSLETPSVVSNPSFLFWTIVYGFGLFIGLNYTRTKDKAFEHITQIIAVLGFLVGLATFVLTRSFEETMILFLLWLQAAKNFSLSTRKDLYFAYGTSFILILYASSLSKDSSFLFYICLYSLAAIFTFMADHIDDRLAHAHRGDQTFLARGLNFPISSVFVTGGIILLAVVIYLIFPRPPSPMVQAFPVGGGTYYHNVEWFQEAEKRQKEQKENGGNFGENQKAGTADGRNPSRDETTQGRRGREGPGNGSAQPDTQRTKEERQDHQGSERLGTDEGRGGEGHDKGSDPGSGQGGDESKYAGFQESFDIAKPGQCYLFNDVVFYLQSDRPIYARGKVFDEFDGRVWTTSKHSDKKIASDHSTFVLDQDVNGKEVGQVYTIEKTLPAFIFAAYKPTTVIFPGSVIAQDREESLKAPSDLRPGTIYSVKSEMGIIRSRPVGGDPNQTVHTRYLQIPGEISNRFIDLSQSLTEGINHSYEKAAAIEQYVKENHQYTFSTISEDPPPDLIDNFLFERKKGHSEYFASSMVMMLRAENIPARLVTGYAATRYNPITGYIEVRRLDAHPWVEAYMEEYGWVSFEPTPGFVLPKQERQTFPIAALTEFTKKNLRLREQTHPESPVTKMLLKAESLLKRIKEFLQHLIDRLKRGVSSLWSLLKDYGVFILASVIGLAVLLYGLREPIAQWAAQQRLRRAGQLGYRRFICQCYFEMEKAFGRTGAKRHNPITPDEYQIDLSRRFAQIKLEVGHITRLFHKARYSHLSLDSNQSDEAYRNYRQVGEFLRTMGLRFWKKNKNNDDPK